MTYRLSSLPGPRLEPQAGIPLVRPPRVDPRVPAAPGALSWGPTFGPQPGPGRHVHCLHTAARGGTQDAHPVCHWAFICCLGARERTMPRQTEFCSMVRTSTWRTGSWPSVPCTRKCLRAMSRFLQRSKGSSRKHRRGVRGVPGRCCRSGSSSGATSDDADNYRSS